MKILYIAPASVNHTVRWVNAMVKKGHDVYLISLKQHSQGENKIDKRVKIHYLPFKGGLGYYLNFIQGRILLKKIEPDIINTHYASGYGTLSRIINKGPVLISAWGSDIYDFPKRNFFNKRILIKNLNAAFKIASTSNVMAEEIKKYTSKTIEITPFGVDINLFRVKKNQKEVDEIRIGIVKTLKPLYGIQYLIKAIYILKNRLIKEDKNDILEALFCDIYGEGEEKEKLEILAKELKVDNMINFHGYIPNNEVPNKLNEMDIFCVTSLAESYGVSVVEAMSCGLPVVASDAEGFKEVMEDNFTGYIVIKKNPNLIAEKLFDLIMDKKKRYQFGKNGRRRVEKFYNWEKNVNHMEQVYLDTIRKWKSEGK